MIDPRTDDQVNIDDDVALVLEAISFMKRINTLSPEERRQLEEIEGRIERRRGENAPQ